MTELPLLAVVVPNNYKAFSHYYKEFDIIWLWSISMNYDVREHTV